ncbi:unnamed protein product [Sphagnum jensenii]|uniref:Protein-serine/threonine phosphatase n=1 Tax=Sphagnum jensenii TaxID=128206 RepID=A0ABP0X4C7_9BRYO
MLCIRFLAAPDSLRDVTYIKNFAALEIRHISRRKMIRVGNPVLQHLSGACRSPPAPSGKKVKTGGDDTFFICHSEKIVGMADGVGG